MLHEDTATQRWESEGAPQREGRAAAYAPLGLGWSLCGREAP